MGRVGIMRKLIFSDAGCLILDTCFGRISSVEGEFFAIQYWNPSERKGNYPVLAGSPEKTLDFR